MPKCSRRASTRRQRHTQRVSSSCTGAARPTCKSTQSPSQSICNSKSQRSPCLRTWWHKSRDQIKKHLVRASTKRRGRPSPHATYRAAADTREESKRARSRSHETHTPRRRRRHTHTHSSEVNQQILLDMSNNKPHLDPKPRHNPFLRNQTQAGSINRTNSTKKKAITKKPTQQIRMDLWRTATQLKLTTVPFLHSLCNFDFAWRFVVFGALMYGCFGMSQWARDNSVACEQPEEGSATRYSKTLGREVKLD